MGNAGNEKQADQKKLFESALLKGFNAGWAAACLSLAAEVQKLGGGDDFAATLREWADGPPEIEIEEIKKEAARG